MSEREWQKPVWGPVPGRVAYRLPPRDRLLTLQYRERRILELRAALVTLDEVGRVFNISRERVRQIEQRALSKCATFKPTAPPWHAQEIAPGVLRAPATAELLEDP